MSIPENGSRGENSEVLSIAQMLIGLGSKVERMEDELEGVSCSLTRLVFCELSLFASLIGASTLDDEERERRKEDEVDSSSRICVRSVEDLALDSRVRRREGGIWGKALSMN